MKNKFFFKKYYKYEFWPFWLFYLPMVPFWVFYSLKSGSLVYFCNVNPKIKWGGFLDYSKYGIYKDIPEKYKTKTFLVNIKKEFDNGLSFPFILKPDIGERGVGVEIIKNISELKGYKKTTTEDWFLQQEIIDLPNEYGLFYAKIPSEKTGKILSITKKEFLTFKGDDKSSLGEFLKSATRIVGRREYLEEKFKHQLNNILKEGEEIILEPIGNHNRGTIFLDGRTLINQKILESVEEVVNKIPHFYFGRLDVKAKDDEALQNGNFKAIEINGANSEATHIFHPGKFSIYQAYKEVLRHLEIQYKIAKQNKKNGFNYPSTVKFAKAIINRLL